MTLRIAQFLAIVLTALALVPGGAHLLELPNKMALSRDDYLTVQAIYRGWWLTGIVLAMALLTNLAVAVMARGRGAPAWWAATATLLFIVFFTIFFVWTEPVNRDTASWTKVGDDWQALRIRWEYSHAANAVVVFLALCAAAMAGLTKRE